METNRIELTKISNAYCITVSIKLEDLKQQYWFEYVSPSLNLRSTNDCCCISFTSKFNYIRAADSEPLDDYSKRREWQLKKSGVRISFDTENNEKRRYYIRQVICSLPSKPDLAMIGFQITNDHSKMTELKHPKFYSLEELLETCTNSSDHIVKICFNVTYAENNAQHSSDDQDDILTLDEASSSDSVSKLKPRRVMYSFVESGEYSDVTLKTRDREFSAHRLVLASRSKVFDAMFRNETQTGVIRLEDSLRSVVVEELLRYVYTNESNHLAQLAHELYAVAHLYNVHGLRDLCKGHISSSICIDNVVKTLELAEKYLLTDLADKAQEFVRVNKLELLKQREFINYLAQRLSPLNVTENLLLADQHNLSDLRICVMEYIAKKFKEVVKAEEYRKLYKTHTHLIWEVDEYISKYSSESTFETLNIH